MLQMAEQGDGASLLQVSASQPAPMAKRSAPRCGMDKADTGSHEEGDFHSMVQKFDPQIPFGSKLSQLQAHLNGFDKEQCEQVTSHLHVMLARLRRLAGHTSPKVTDRFQRLEALVAGYMTQEVDTPLDLQVWAESQLKILIPYLNAGRTPVDANDEAERCTLRPSHSSRAAASTDVVEVINSSEVAEVPEYRVLNENGTWTAATEEQAAEFKAHDEALEMERRQQETADKAAYADYEAGMAQRWDDWALSSEMGRVQQEPSRKRVRITVIAGTSSGQEIGEAVIEGVIGHDQTAAVTVSTVETALGGIGEDAAAPLGGASLLATQAAPQLADFDPNHLPGLPENVNTFMMSVEGRHWLWQFQIGAVPITRIEERFGSGIAEAFQLWLALREDLEHTVKNVGALPVEVEDLPDQSDAETECLEASHLARVTTDAAHENEGMGSEGGRELERVQTQIDGQDTNVVESLEHADAAEPPGEGRRPREGDGEPSGERDQRPQGDDPGSDEQRCGGDACGNPMMDIGATADARDGAGDAAANAPGGAEAGGDERTSDAARGQVWSEDPADPYYVPVAWRGMLAAWNQEARAEADSSFSVGHFEHSLEDTSETTVSGAGGHLEHSLEDVSAAMASGVAGVPVLSSGSSTTATTDEGPGVGSGSLRGGQTDLRGWLRQ